MSSDTGETTWTPPSFGSPCWIEIPAADVQSCKNFYSALFPKWDWKPATEQHPDEKIAMFSFSAGKAGLTGGIVQVSASCKKAEEMTNGVGVTVYHLVESIEATQKHVELLGGKTKSGKEKEGNNGFYMYFLDTEGNRFGVYEYTGGS